MDGYRYPVEFDQLDQYTEEAKRALYYSYPEENDILDDEGERCRKNDTLGFPTGSEANQTFGFKLFVGCLPFDASENDLLPLFEQYGDVLELTVQRDRLGRSKGCAWLKFASREQCDRTIDSLHGQFYVGNVRQAIQVKYAYGEEGCDEEQPVPRVNTENKLFVGGLPMDSTEEDLRHAFMAYGVVQEVYMLRKNGSFSGAAFVRMGSRDAAEKIIDDAERGLAFRIGVGECTGLRISYATSTGSREGVEQSLGGPRIPTVINPITNLAAESLQPVKLFIGCLPYSKNVYDLANLFHPFGPILEVALLATPDGKSRGAAFVTFAYAEHASSAVNRLNGFLFPQSTRPINVSFATKQSFGKGIPHPPITSQKHITYPAQSTHEKQSKLESSPAAIGERSSNSGGGSLGPGTGLHAGYSGFTQRQPTMGHSVGKNGAIIVDGDLRSSGDVEREVPPSHPHQSAFSPSRRAGDARLVETYPSQGFMAQPPARREQQVHGSKYHRPVEYEYFGSEFTSPRAFHPTTIR